jgi:hypothetical protein
MQGMKTGSTYRCANRNCGAQVQAMIDCGCGEGCQPTCCGEKMLKM